MEQLSTNTRNLRKLVDDVDSWLHYPPCPNKKVVNKRIDIIIYFFGKSSNISLRELDFTFLVKVALKMMMPSLVGRTFGMRCTPFYSIRTWLCCMGSAERSWSNEKTIKNGKRANIGGEYQEKRVILYTSSKLEEAQLQRSLD